MKDSLTLDEKRIAANVDNISGATFSVDASKRAVMEAFKSNKTAEKEKNNKNDSGSSADMTKPTIKFYDTAGENYNSNVEVKEDNIKYTVGKSKSTNWSLDGPTADEFVEVKVDDKTIPASNYKLDSKFVTLELNKSYLDTLKTKTYSVKIFTKKGYAEAKLEVVNNAKKENKENNPNSAKTADKAEK